MCPLLVYRGAVCLAPSDLVAPLLLKIPEVALAMLAFHSSFSEQLERHAHLLQVGALMNDAFQAQDGLPPSLFPPDIPVFTGHYHKPHTVGDTNIRYVGSPYQGECHLSCTEGNKSTTSSQHPNNQADSLHDTYSCPSGRPTAKFFVGHTCCAKPNMTMSISLLHDFFARNRPSTQLAGDVLYQHDDDELP